MSGALPSVAAAALLACLGCVPPAATGAGASGGPPGPLPAPGSGTLRQDEITIQLTSGDLQIKVTPLSESVIRTAAPDTYRVLSGLAGRFSPEAVRRTGSAEPALFLVSFFSMAPDVAFVPEELQLIAQGSRRRPDVILPVTPTWGERRLAQRETETAVYAFGSGVDLESDLVVAYGLVESTQWSSILPRVQAERARARARGERP
jgi:hypothetical protein